MDELLTNNLESEAPNEDIIHTDSTESINDLNNNEEAISNITEEAVPQNTEIANSLALTIKKDYSIAIAKNVFIKTLRSTWKIVLSVFTLNILKFFL